MTMKIIDPCICTVCGTGIPRHDHAGIEVDTSLDRKIDILSDLLEDMVVAAEKKQVVGTAFLNDCREYMGREKKRARVIDGETCTGPDLKALLAEVMGVAEGLDGQLENCNVNSGVSVELQDLRARVKAALK
jgi:hypothetical protein